MNQIKIMLEKNHLCLCFDEENTQSNVLKALENKGIDIFHYSKNLKSYFKPYTTQNNQGCFLSAEGRVGLIFSSEKLKFFFKESIGLPSEYFIDMGPGYETQLHFNEKKFPFVDGAFLMMTPPDWTHYVSD